MGSDEVSGEMEITALKTSSYEVKDSPGPKLILQTLALFIGQSKLLL